MAASGSVVTDHSEDSKRELYSEHACHELHLFVYFHDPAFFDKAVAPLLCGGGGRGGGAAREQV